MIRTALLAGLFSFCFVGFASAEEPPSPRPDRCVLMISVDGLAGFYLDDPRADLPMIRELIANGARANELTCVFPTVTWPNHTTLVTGVVPAVHGVLGNKYLDRETQKSVALIADPVYDKDQIIRVDTIYDLAHRAGMKTGAIMWPASRGAASLDWTVPDMPSENDWANHGTDSWLSELKRAGVPVDRHGAWSKDAPSGVKNDWLYTLMARHMLEHHAPQLLLVHLIELDHVQHQSGPRSVEAYWAAKQADDRVRDLVHAAQKFARGREVSVVLCSDHGFFPIERDIRLNVLFQQERFGAEEPVAKCVAHGGACMVYITDDERREQIASRLLELIPRVEGIEDVYPPARFGELGQPLPGDDPRAPDLWVTARTQYCFTDSDSGENIVVPRATAAGTHGYLPRHPELFGTLVLSGAGVRSGVELGTVSNTQVAPTVARLLGLRFSHATGEPLTEALLSADR